jgi:hypothetical protein
MTVNEQVQSTWKEDVAAFSRSYIGISLGHTGKKLKDLIKEYV